jgi:hypothetical protein
MSTGNDGGPAFPKSVDLYSWESRDDGMRITGELTGGMTLREYFAGQALVGLLASGHSRPAEVAEGACQYADALLAELAKG